MEKLTEEKLTEEKQKAVEAVEQCEDPGELGNLLWKVIELYAGEQFYTSKGLPFTYRIKGRELFCDRREKSITESTFRLAYEKVKASAETDQPIRGPKKLNMFGAPYIWSILKQIGLVGTGQEESNEKSFMENVQLSLDLE